MNTNFDLMITHLCIDSPYAEIELTDSLVEWQFESNNIDVNNISEAISAINIDTVTVRAKGNIQFLERSATEKLSKTNAVKFSDLPNLIRKQLYDISLFSMPIEIDIRTFSYQPFGSQADNKIQTYQGQISAHAQQFLFTLTNQKEEDVISLALAKKGDDITANLATDLTQLKSLLIQHQTALPLSLSTLLINESWSVTGKVKSQLDWHKNILSMTNQLSDFSFEALQGFALLESVKLGKTFAWQTKLMAENLYFDFNHEEKPESFNNNYQGNNIQLAFNSEKLIESLTAQKVDQQIINVLIDNVISTLAVKPLDSLKIDFTKKTVTSDGVTVISRNLNEPIKLSLNDLILNYRDDSAITVNLEKAKFSLTGQASIAQLQPYSLEPIKLSITGGIEQHSDIWQLILAQETTIELAQLSLPSVKPTSGIKSLAQTSNSKAQLKVKSLISHLHGDIAIPKNNLKSKSKNSEPVTFELELNNQVSQLHYPKILQVNGLELNTTILGSIDNITINTKVIADNVPIAAAKFTGDLRHPNVVVSAKGVLLTDLLALKVELPVELKLIDGNIDYHLSGQLKNNKDLWANPMTLALTVQDFTGEVEGIWLQDLNWQQKFFLQNGQIKSIPEKHTTLYNLTIAKVETGTPIHNLATTTVIDFSKNQIKMLAHNTHGNLLGGNFDIAKMQWPFSKELLVKIKLTKIDLEKLLELDKKQGIVVTGKVSGEFPILYDGENFLIKEGYLYNVGNGLIQVYNNPAVEELKGSSTELKLAFDALENLHYHHLTSEISMADDGYMLLITVIKGKNPDLDNDVNLNLNLSYDLLGLLESLNITELFESKVIKGLKK